MQLTFTGARFELICNKVEAKLAKEAGFHWDFQGKKWWTGRADVAKKFEMYADPKARERLNRDTIKIEMSRAISSDIFIPVPEGLDYLPFQKAGIEFALTRNDTLIGDEMRLGKTIQAIGLINADNKARRILVICPAFIKINWARELQKWTVKKLTGGFATSQELPDTDIVIMNYDIVYKLREKIDRRKWDLLICDEAHYLKGESRRAKAVLGNVTKPVTFPIEATRRVFLTGTPILNRPVELWNILRVIDPEGLGSSHWNYVRKYCAAFQGPWGWDFSGASNLEELQQRLRLVMVRRTKEQVLPELPPIRRQIIPIPGDAVKNIVQAEKDFYEKNQAAFDAAVAEAQAAKNTADDASYKEAAKQLKSLKQVMFEQMSKLRHDTAVAKIPYMIDYLKECLQSEAKIVCFCHHHDVINGIASQFGNEAVQHHGNLSVDQKQASVDRFKDDPNCRLLVAGISSAMGYSAASATLGIMAEMSWVPGDMDQAEKRLDDIKQIKSILIQYVVFDESLDALMAKRVIKKQEVIKEALDLV